MITLRSSKSPVLYSPIGQRVVTSLIDAGPIAFLAHSPLRSPEVSAIVMGTWGPIPPQQQRQQQQGYDCLLRCMSRDDPQQQHGFGALCSADFVVCPGMFSRPQCATPIAL